MAKEQDLQNNLTAKFPFLEGKFKVIKNGRIFLSIPYENFRAVFDYAISKDVCPHLCTITGLDEGEVFGIIYHLAAKNGALLNLETNVPKNNPVIKSIAEICPSATLYERELEDLLGIQVEGLPKGRRYPLPDDWPQGDHPLLKDWKPKNPA